MTTKELTYTLTQTQLDFAKSCVSTYQGLTFFDNLKPDDYSTKAQQFAQPASAAVPNLTKAFEGLGAGRKANKHRFWGAGEPDCPPELKAPNGEIHTLRCKVCGDDWRANRDVCQQPESAKPLPLTDARLLDAFCITPGIHQFITAFKAGARYAEAHHGITQEKQA